MGHTRRWQGIGSEFWGASTALALCVAGCGGAITPGDAGRDAAAISDSSIQDAAVSGCTLSNGSVCPAGQSCPAGDGCNTCSCPSSGGFAACTLLACVPDASPVPDATVDAPAPACVVSSECGAGRACHYPFDRCTTTGVCELEVVCGGGLSTYCSCNGATYTPSTDCLPDRPTMHSGPCGTTACHTAADCGGAMECVYPVDSCGGAGHCETLTDCAPRSSFCDCSGTTFMACAGRPTRPTRSEGACTDTTACTGACGPGAASLFGGACLGAADGACPNECCQGWDCDTRRHAPPCRSLAPLCAPGLVNTVTSSCWGPCVPALNCAAMPCASDAECPDAFACGAAGQCVAR